MVTFEERRLLKLALSAHRLAREQLLDNDLTVGDKRECGFCGDVFVMVKGRQRFCSPQHQRQANRRESGAKRARAAARRRRYHELKEAA